MYHVNGAYGKQTSPKLDYVKKKHFKYIGCKKERLNGEKKKNIIVDPLSTLEYISSWRETLQSLFRTTIQAMRVAGSWGCWLVIRHHVPGQQSERCLPLFPHFRRRALSTGAVWGLARELSHEKFCKVFTFTQNEQVVCAISEHDGEIKCASKENGDNEYRLQNMGGDTSAEDGMEMSEL